jgi:hypothetical protein
MTSVRQIVSKGENRSINGHAPPGFSHLLIDRARHKGSLGIKLSQTAQIAELPDAAVPPEKRG